ncbi:hypothetical protein [Planotetraspora silvatica]|uniref:hypothetical protein n=1 Tax=Planotetraspora silvatica TaxID=234614 RepID=UPI0019517E73|nr:hypothetical protein [Planotetraspora silvatica]
MVGTTWWARRGGHDVVDLAQPGGERLDARLVGQVDGLGLDAGILVRSGQPAGVPASHDHGRARGADGEGDGTGDSAPATHDEDSAHLRG